MFLIQWVDLSFQNYPHLILQLARNKRVFYCFNPNMPVFRGGHKLISFLVGKVFRLLRRLKSLMKVGE